MGAGVNGDNQQENESRDTDSLRYFKPSFLPDASSASDSRMRFSRVSGRMAE